VRAALGRAAGCRAEAARELGLTRQGLLKTMRRLGLGRPLTSEAPGS
jgi:transcriptional regulator with GAF, ATPase, and Fis domain